VAQTIQTIDELDKTLNLMMGRIREWYGLHFPELDRILEKHETYARLVNELGLKENFTDENLEKEGLPKAKAQHIAEAAKASMGADFTEGDINQLQSLSRNVLGLFEARKKLESHLDVIMDEVAPNTRNMVGSLLGARLIAITGGLNNLAKMPASTVQVLGAEKALFRALKTGARPPKHGLIFQHTLIHDASPWQRGKIARALAGKLAIAARTDAFSGKYAGYMLQASLDRRIKEIRERYKEAPPPKAPRREKFSFRREKFSGRRKRGRKG
jgi:nucleolar protein 56